MPKPIFDEQTFRNAVTRFEVNSDPASAQRIVTGAGAVLRLLDKARAEVERLRAGEDPTPSLPHEQLTPARWLHRFNEMTPAERLARAKQAMDDLNARCELAEALERIRPQAGDRDAS